MVVWYVVGLVRPAKTAPEQIKGCVPHSRGIASDTLEEGGDANRGKNALEIKVNVISISVENFISSIVKFMSVFNWYTHYSK